jgi:hypothetical protein
MGLFASPRNVQPIMIITDSDRWRGKAALRLKKQPAHVAQLVEHILGKDEVTSSILVVGSIEVRWFNHEKYHYIGLHGLQTAELYDDQEQKDHAESAGDEKILQILPVP